MQKRKNAKTKNAKHKNAKQHKHTKPNKKPTNT